ncbi:hypothetical protein HNP84_003748 [Thermocatellispora tengchongensis]|uniref:Uncharacterized protein n=1 Tax=Thermocatellispora tengchongensis TaxID=1073253 RepID=A0A840P3T0_9ACTN|nr:hypothetical protein [Thermocatellispora tengchongensis]MBB5134022.1 hypothetical protein [Thermocatellispora tengchongensis]
MISVKMNDDAAALLGVLDGPGGAHPPGGLSADLRERLAEGIAWRGDVLTWASCPGMPDGASRCQTLTYWESSASSFHLEPYVLDEATMEELVAADGPPVIREDDQRLILQHGIAFALEFSRLVHALDPPCAVRCIVAVNETNGTFRFHRIRPDERWNTADLDTYELDKLVEIDIEPAAR